jgi:hypothetical protein
MKLSTKIAAVGAGVALLLAGASSASAFPILHIYHPIHHVFFPSWGHGPGWGYGYGHGPGWGYGYGHGPVWGHHWGHRWGHHW